MKTRVCLKYLDRNCHDRFRVDISSVHVLICITFAVFEYLGKRWQRKKDVLPYKKRSANVNLALTLYFRGHTSHKKVLRKKEGVATRSIARLKRAWLIS